MNKDEVRTWHCVPGLPGAQELHRLYAALGWLELADFSPERLLEAHRASWRVLAVRAGRQEEQGELVGIGRIVSDGIFHAIAVGVGVDPAWQGLGIGTAIIQSLIHEAHHAGMGLQLSCKPGLMEWYQARGFLPGPVAMQCPL